MKYVCLFCCFFLQLNVRCFLNFETKGIVSLLESVLLLLKAAHLCKKRTTIITTRIMKMTSAATTTPAIAAVLGAVMTSVLLASVEALSNTVVVSRSVVLSVAGGKSASSWHGPM